MLNVAIIALALCFAGCTGNAVKEESTFVAPTEAMSQPGEEPPQEESTDAPRLPSWLVGCWQRREIRWNLGNSSLTHVICWEEEGEALVGEAATFDGNTQERTIGENLRLELRDGAVFYITRSADAETAREFRLVAQEEASQEEAYFVAEEVAERAEGDANSRVRYELEGIELRVLLSGDGSPERTLVFTSARAVPPLELDETPEM